MQQCLHKLTQSVVHTRLTMALYVLVVHSWLTGSVGSAWRRRAKVVTARGPALQLSSTFIAATRIGGEMPYMSGQMRSGVMPSRGSACSWRASRLAGVLVLASSAAFNGSLQHLQPIACRLDRCKMKCKQPAKLAPDQLNLIK